MRLYIRLWLASAALMGASLMSAPVHAAAVKVEYTAKLPEEVRDQIKDRLPDERDAESALHARRQARRARRLVQSILNSYGYYSPTISIELLGDDGRAEPRLIIDPGAPFTVGRILVRYVGQAPQEEHKQDVRDVITLKEGDPAVAADVIDVER